MMSEVIPRHLPCGKDKNTNIASYFYLSTLAKRKSITHNSNKKAEKNIFSLLF